MKNPFDPNSQQEKFEFFNQMTSVIDEWISKKYPIFNQQFLENIERLKVLQKQAEDSLSYYQTYVNNQKKDFLDHCKKEINNFLEVKFPGAASKFSQTTLEAERLIKNQKKSEEKFEKLIKTLSNSKSLYEDVYRLRDEMKELNRIFDKLKHKMELLFK